MSDINVTVQDEIVNIDVLDTPVIVEVTNSPGQQGPAGVGVPVGGTTGQVLAKSSATDYATNWVNPSGGTWGSITGTLSNQTDLQNALNAKFDDPTGTTSQYLIQLYNTFTTKRKRYTTLQTKNKDFTQLHKTCQNFE